MLCWASWSTTSQLLPASFPHEEKSTILYRGIDCTCGQQPFQALFTLFPEYFSPFDQSTCALSALRTVFSLDKDTPAVRAALPRSSTLPDHTCSTAPLLARRIRGYHPLPQVDLPIKLGRCRTENRGHAQLHPATPIVTSVPPTGLWAGSQTRGLLSLHSPLLRQSLLFSLPPPTDMLKLGGYSPVSSSLRIHSSTALARRLVELILDEPRSGQI